MHTVFLHSQGDSGGALLAQDRQLLGWSAVGIVSYQPGVECGTDNYVVFTELRSDIGLELCLWFRSINFKTLSVTPVFFKLENVMA